MCSIRQRTCACVIHDDLTTLVLMCDKPATSVSVIARTRNCFFGGDLSLSVLVIGIVLIIPLIVPVHGVRQRRERSCARKLRSLRIDAFLLHVVHPNGSSR